MQWATLITHLTSCTRKRFKINKIFIHEYLFEEMMEQFLLFVIEYSSAGESKLVNPLLHNPGFFKTFGKQLFVNMVREKILVTSIFSFSHNVFCSIKEYFYYLGHY